MKSVAQKEMPQSPGDNIVRFPSLNPKLRVAHPKLRPGSCDVKFHREISAGVWELLNAEEEILGLYVRYDQEAT